MIGSKRIDNGSVSYLPCIKCRVVEPIGPVHDIRALLSILENVLVRRLVNRLYLVAAKDDRLDCPDWAYDIVDLGRDGGDNSKVVTCTLHAPPEIRLGVNCL